ncbi:hypothetical protein LTR36_006466 [Oleoguttula mirabilis]|uniref:Protein BFR2 n=1 Tax=Oleoguttula mirabilis TaxID=1507867 RepID=A0AAV9JV44_9PEZI|nr:hypothetical protein LTR36_006466 [Oleoguttula mirabilis]
MAPLKGRNRAAEFEDIVDQAPKDFDPEGDDIPDNASDSADDLDDSDSEAGDDAREHYVDVGKSKLRKPKEMALGPQYRGSRVSRDAVTEDEDEDDPFGRGFDDEESEDDDVATGDEAMSEEELDGEDEDDGTPDTDLSDDEAARPRPQAMGGDQDRSELLKAMADEQKSVATSLSQASRADAEKGRAVKKQRTAFDSLLSTRMKLQKALVGVNTASGLPPTELEDQRLEATNALQAAETAAFSLWSSLNSFRDDLIAAKTGQKRKRSTFSTTTPTSKLWAHMQTQEESSQTTRSATLQKWSAKTRGPTATPQRTRINNAEHQSTVMDVIQEQLSNSERLIKRTQTPRSCAPLQVANKVTEDERIYDDADFYGLMLKELLEQKSQDSVVASNIDVNFQMRREAKTKKNVDTKASKGRKLRYTVHEKLQNFMAPEDRSTWGERQADELFGSLFGQRLGLGEERTEGDEEMGDGVDAQEAGLMMFRS